MAKPRQTRTAAAAGVRKNPRAADPAGAGKPPRPAGVRTRRAVLDLLKQHGPQEAQALADQLGVSAMAVRQHLYDLQEQGLVGHDAVPRAVGRPAKRWHLTVAADRLFPDGHADLTASLLESMRETFGETGMDQLMAVRTREQIAAYERRMPRGAGLHGRLRALARLRSEEGYMAAVEAEGQGRYLLIENHCPIVAAAAVCSGLCGSEMAVFEHLLGPDVTVERVDHILAGARRCAYRVTKAGPPGKAS